MDSNRSALNRVPLADNFSRRGQSSRPKEASSARRGSKGFTLIEILIVIVVVSVLSIFGYQFLTASVHTYSMMEKQKGLYDEGAMAMERISRESRDANSVTSPASGGTGPTLAFTKSHGSPEDTETDVTFELVAGKLQRVTTSSTVDLAEKVSAFTVTRVTSAPLEEITIVLTLSETTGESVTLWTKICPKNLSPESGRNFGGNWQEDFQ